MGKASAAHEQKKRGGGVELQLRVPAGRERFAEDGGRGWRGLDDGVQLRRAGEAGR